jgi:hypothetical protein
MRSRAELRGAADAAAIAAAKEMSLTDTKRENLAAVAESVAKRQLGAVDSVRSDQSVTISTAVSSSPLQVVVTATRPFQPAFGSSFGLTKTKITVRSSARVIGKPNICVLGLNSSDAGTISLEYQARVTGRNCAVYSNSSSPTSILSKGQATLSASIICTHGGKSGAPGSFDPEPLTDCPSFEDPLAARPEPVAGTCNPAMPRRIFKDTSLNPGTYCGLEIVNGASVTLAPGIYVFTAAPLIVKDNAKLIGDGVGLYFTGDAATFLFEPESTIDLKAPKSGPLAGLLVFASRQQTSSASYRILSNNARVLIGTIYIPNGELRIDATNPVADQSAYTAIVASTMRLYGGPHLILNTNYSETEVPVPDGIKGAGQPVRLAE